MRLLVLTLAAAVSGCSLFESGSSVLDVRPLLDANSAVRYSGFGPTVVLQSDADEAAFFANGGPGPFPRDVDYRRETVVGVVFPASAPGGRVSVQAVSVDGDRLAFVIDAEGSIGLPEDAPAVAFPASLVTVPRLRQDIRGATFSYPGLDG